MKKLFILGTILLSTSLFSAGNMGGMMQGGKMENMPMMQGGMQCQCPMMGAGGKGMMASKMMTPEMKKDMQMQKIAIQEKELEISKTLAQDKIDWAKVEQLNRDIAHIRATNETKMMQMHYEMMQNPGPLYEDKVN
ncbi:hypothetical protein [Cetobacterium sp.]|uniref:hypothetical protein n=1 Tax=Cetobacterium sp. TaxID=2071632 RepID=UPI003EE6BEEA